MILANTFDKWMSALRSSLRPKKIPRHQRRKEYKERQEACERTERRRCREESRRCAPSDGDCRESGSQTSISRRMAIRGMFGLLAFGSMNGTSVLLADDGASGSPVCDPPKIEPPGDADPQTKEDILRTACGLATAAEEEKDGYIAVDQRLDKMAVRQGKRLAQLVNLEGWQEKADGMFASIFTGMKEYDAIALEVCQGLMDLRQQSLCLLKRQEQILCMVSQLECRLRGLACAIRAAIRRAFVKGFIIGFIVGLLTGIGISAAIGGGGGAGIASAAFF